MERRTVQLSIAGQSYRVISSASEADLQRLAQTITDRVSQVGAPRGASAQGMVLAAMSLAHDLEVERSRREALERKTRDLLRRVLLRIDDALDAEDGDAEQASEQ